MAEYLSIPETLKLPSALTQYVAAASSGSASDSSHSFLTEELRVQNVLCIFRVYRYSTFDSTGSFHFSCYAF
jgi:hypothetical protein